MSDILLLSMPYSKSYGKINIKDLDFGVPHYKRNKII